VILALVHRLRGGRRRGEPHLQLARLDPCLEDRQRLERRWAEDVAGAEVELRCVTGTDDHALLELAVGERAVLVRAGVLKGDPAVGRPAETDGGTLDLDPAEETDRGLLRRADAVPRELAHRSLLS